MATKKSTSQVKTTARGGKAKSPAARTRSHVARSTGGGAGSTTSGASRTVNRPPTATRTKRGPGAMGKEVGRAQHAAGKGRAGTPKRAK
jgi:hypothetical protein